MIDLVNPNIIVSLSGFANSGKTHLALTFPDPIAYFDFDIGGVMPVLKKFPGKRVDLKSYPIPIIDSDPPKPYASEIWHQVDEDYKDACAGGKYKTIVIDTATALWEIIRHSVAEEIHQKKLLEVQYTMPNLRMRSLFARAQLSGVNLVTLQYLADRYVKGENTGELGVKGWQETETKSDIAIWCTMKVVRVGGGKNDVYVESSVHKDRFLREMNGQILRDATYDDLLALTGV